MMPRLGSSGSGECPISIGRPAMPRLGVNIDHVATVRQARRTYEPDPVWAAAEAQLGGADGITFHLREDRRHINDRDARLLKETVTCKLNMEMSINRAIVAIARQLKPDQCTLVPERREELTTEGGAGRRPAGQEGPAGSRRPPRQGHRGQRLHRADPRPGPGGRRRRLRSGRTLDRRICPCQGPPGRPSRPEAARHRHRSWPFPGHPGPRRPRPDLHQRPAGG